MDQTELVVNVRVEGLREVIRALNNLPKNANDEIREKARVIAGKLAETAKQAGRAEGRQAGAVIKTVRVQRDRLPVVVAGGMRKLGRNKKPAYKLLFGSEFGATVLKQYKPHLGKDSYWFFKTIEEERTFISAEWLEAADEIIRKFGGAV